MHTVFPNLPIPIEQTTLANGFTVMTGVRPHAALVEATLIFPVGSYHDRVNSGIAHFVEHVVRKGENNIHPALLATEIRTGAYDNAFTHAFETEFQIYDGPRANLRDMVMTLAEMTLRPAITEKIVKTERSIILQEIAETATEVLLSEQRDRVLYPSQTTLHYNPRGRVDTVRAITRANIRGHHRLHYNLSHAALAVVGDVDHAFAVKLAEDLCHRYGASGRRRPPHPRIAPKLKGTATIVNEYTPTGISIFFQKPKTAREEMLLEFTLDLLTADPLGILWQALRERDGISYGIDTLVSHSPESFTEISTACDPDAFDHAEREISSAISRLIRGDYESELFTMTKQRWENDLLKRRTDPLDEDLALDVARSNWLMGDAENPDLPALYESFTPDLVSEVAERYLTKPYGSIRVVNE